MKLLDILSAPWAIIPEKLEEIQEIYIRHLRGPKLDIKAIEAKIGKIEAEPYEYQVVDGVAVLPLCGVIGKKMNLFQKISGGTSSELFRKEFFKAVLDDDVNSILITIDSPGGTIDGTLEAAEAIYGARGDKPVVAFTDGMMASAAYWIGSAADAIYISGNTTTVGSIGVVAQHFDYSEAYKKEGVKVTEIFAGKYKRIASEYKPLSREAKNTIQEQVDYYYAEFVDSIARHRGVSTETVLKNMADGRIFIGKQAITAGLVDGVSTESRLISLLADGVSALKEGVVSVNIRGNIINHNAFAREMVPSAVSEGQIQTTGTTINDKEVPMSDDINKITPTADFELITKEKLEEMYPELIIDIKDEAYVMGLASGAEEERMRIMDVEAQLIPGHEDLIDSLKFDGKTTGEEAASRVVVAEKVRQETIVTQMKDGAIDPVNDAEPVDTGPKDFESMVKEYQEAKKCTRGEAIRKIATMHPLIHKQYINKLNDIKEEEDK
jgi:signal peptide peptidase SppA